MTPTGDGGADLLLQTFLPTAFTRRGVLAAWLAYPRTGRSVRIAVCARPGGPTVELPARAAAALGLPVGEPLEARTLLVLTGDPPEGFDVVRAH
jgi:hypothetical protein